MMYGDIIYGDLWIIGYLFWCGYNEGNFFMSLGDFYGERLFFFWENLVVYFLFVNF